MNQPKFNIGDKVFVKKECIEHHIDITNREYEIHAYQMQTSSPYCIIDDNGDCHFFMEDELFVGIKISVNMIEERIEQLYKSIKFSDSEIGMLTEQINSHVKKNAERNADIVILNQAAEILSKNS